MATASKIRLEIKHQPVFSVRSITQESADKASELLQDNHDRHHIFFNNEGFHNHIAHHLLSLYALGATPDELQHGYNLNKHYQRPRSEANQQLVASMHDKENLQKCLGKEQHYADFLAYFEGEIEKSGWETVLQEYLFKEDGIANDLFVRLFSGFLHPIIHLGFGVEFRQPAIIAEALAQAAVHDDWIGNVLRPAEEAAKSAPRSKTPKSLVQLLEEIRADKHLSTAAHWDDGNKIRDGIIARAGDKMVVLASQYTVSPDDIPRRTAEMTNAAIYFTAAAQHPPKLVRFDFYFMHCVNSSVFFPAFMALPFLTDQQKCRLLEWKGRIDLAMYASRRSPKPLLEEITNYKPKSPEMGWDQLFARARKVEDDGHAIKFIRAIAHGKEISAQYEKSPEFKVKGETWDRLGHAAIDSVEVPGFRWIRSAGFDEAWQEVPDRQVALL